MTEPLRIDDDWHDYTSDPARAGHTVSGTLVFRRIEHATLPERSRDALVYLPPSYAEGGTRRYPVLYMHDGQNLFDARTSFAGEWQVDESMERLARDEGIEAIVVGVPNAGAARMDEYSAFHQAGYGGGAAASYLDYLCGAVKPAVERAFRTLPGRHHTGVAGSSLGGWISVWALFERPDQFGWAGAFSPAAVFAGGALVRSVAARSSVGGRIYMDVGTREGAGEPKDRLLGHYFSRQYLHHVRRLRRALLGLGYREPAELDYREFEGAIHNEAAWAERFPDAVRHFLAGETRP